MTRPEARADTSTDDIDDVVALVDLGGDRFTGPNLQPTARVFSGQLVAQSVVAAARTGDGKRVQSVHLVFGRSGDMERSVVIEVARDTDGRTFATRTVRARQGDAILASGVVMLREPAEPDGFDHQETRAPDAGTPSDATPVVINLVPGEIRSVGGVDLAARTSGPATHRWWFRMPVRRRDGAHVQAVVAHATCRTLIGTALRAVDGVSERDARDSLQTAVTTHSVWFHDDCDVSDWLLVDQIAPVLRGGRAFGRGDVFTASGRVVASFSQESLVRRRA